MNKQEFIDTLSKELGSAKTDAAKILDTVLQCIAQSLEKDDALKFTGFGTFKGKNYPAREMKSIDGKMITVPAQRRVTLSAGKGLKDVVNARSKTLVKND